MKYLTKPLLGALTAIALSACSGVDCETVGVELMEAVGSDNALALELIEEHGKALADCSCPLFPEQEGRVSEPVYTPLHAAVYVGAWDGDYRVIDALIEAGADINAPGPDGCTPMDMLVAANPAGADIGNFLQFQELIVGQRQDLVQHLRDQGAEGRVFDATWATYGSGSRPASADMLDEMTRDILGQ